MRCAMPPSFCFAAAACAQQIGQNAPAGGNGTVTFTTSTQLVVETVVVTDKNGGLSRA